MHISDFLDPQGWLGQSAGPRYVQLRRRIEKAIDTGILSPDSSLPPEREIAEITDLSRVTVRKAIQELVKLGVVEQRQGSGSFVRAPVARVEQSLSHLTSFTEDMKRRGLETTSRWLERGVFIPSPEEVLTLGLAAGDSVARIYRLREAGGQPMALERASLPLDILPNPIEVSRSLYEVLEQSGNRPVRAIQKISAINLNPEDADLLGVAEGTAGLSIQRISYLDSGRVAELTRSVYRGDAYDFVAELRLST
ncbi:transcriptional regulator, GntR family [Aliiroseovarius halocynthiae]|uniref:GntR family transcriptional regulator n=1 Tax=Aliiroseovarius halocynthiae TaxID=985055 RepID=A0A545SQE1_9RHOB|nr:GntR family transcriptional regulator [Aliiroseovarius halocynthiae]TQV67174.1 GntR family transcriptional regulator [Aliiroseovarius halocynthiae]SMR82095.1 transcriptional regulator, GntR family [Aliiroseovarius halocynthiae]